MGGDTHRPGTGSTTAVRGGERFMQVEVHHIDPQIARSDDSQQRIHVGAIPVHQAASLVNQVGDLQHIFIEETSVLGLVSIKPASVSSH